jgi:NAD+ synthase
MPENESSPESAQLAQDLARHFQVEVINENISPALDGFGCYRRRDEAIQRVFPDYVPGWKAKIVLPGNLLEQQTLNIFRLVVSNPQGEEFSKRLPLNEYYQIVAASNFKQRARMTTLYYHAELRNYAVIGTANKNEHDLGFFVKYGDGGADLQPIAHLFKTQVYQLAKFLGVPEDIQRRTPTTDTYPGGSTQEEFFYRVPFDLLDAVWFGYEQGHTNEEIAAALRLTSNQIERVVRDIESKKRATEYLRLAPVMF